MARIRDLVARRTRPANPSEREIAGYRDVLQTIHTHPQNIALTPAVVLQLHRDLFRFVPGGGGRWKTTNNDITETRPDGTTAVRFKPLAAHLTDFRYADLERALPAVSRPTIARALRQLSEQRMVRCVGRGRDATWKKLAVKPARRRKPAAARRRRGR